jgi:hypothetical protein
MEIHFQDWHYQFAVMTSLHMAHNFIQPCTQRCQHIKLAWHTAARNNTLLPNQRKVNLKHRPYIEKENKMYFVSNEITSVEWIKEMYKEEYLEELQIYPLTSLNIYLFYCLHDIN